ncbi:MAG: hypothetical protein HY567_03805 [Candidatus Kerfeldbacteria bacterium]|nr:hypothetical protein [Candidatus Kerfeldbacteria bacterium]
MKRLVVMVGIALAIGLWAWATEARAATLFLSPSSKTVTVGDSLSLSLKVNAGASAINAAEATVSFPANLLQLTSVSQRGSIFTFWAVEPSGSNASGTVRFSGGLPNPGYSGLSGTIAVMNFSAKTTGTAKLTISGAQVLANDGKGTNVLTSAGSGSFEIKRAGESPPPPPAVPGRPTPGLSSRSHPDSNAWYREATAVVSWTKPAGLEAVSFELNQRADTVPDDTPEANTGQVELKLAAEGVWYVHLKGRYSSGWSGVGHYRIQFDATAPEAFAIDVTRDRGATDPSPQLTFTAHDATSGIVRYTLSLDGAEAYEVGSPLTLQLERAGSHRVAITAIDQAGNTREATVDLAVEGYAPPTVTNITTPIILLDALTVRGLAQPGDTVTVFVNEQEVGKVIVVTTIQPGGRAPWILTTDKLFRPGRYRVTATATSADGHVSVPADAVEFSVTGKAFLLNGRVVATVSALPVITALAAAVLVAIIGLVVFLLVRLQLIRHKELEVEDELETLRTRVHRSRPTGEQIEATIEKIERDLLRRKPKRSSRKGTAAN